MIHLTTVPCVKWNSNGKVDKEAIPGDPATLTCLTGRYMHSHGMHIHKHELHTHI